MARPSYKLRVYVLGSFLLACGLCLWGCQTFKKKLSDHLTHWNMLNQDAVEDPIKAVGGDGIVFGPAQDDRPLSRRDLAAANPETLVNYYAPVFVQQRVNTKTQTFPYPPEYDMIGEAHLKKDANGKLKSYVAGQPKLYVICKKLPINGREHVQITYTAWYPAHPRMKTIDLEEADIDSCVVRVTLDADNAPVLYETIAACGCFHKVFVERWLEDAAKQQYGLPEQGRNFSVEKTVPDGIDWEVAGAINEARDQPRRPVVFLKAGDHKVIGMGSAAHLRVPRSADKRAYDMTSYADLYTIKVDSASETGAFFDMDNGGKVRGAERKKEKFFMTFIGVDSAGQPRADDQIKMHFDESTWGDTTTYTKFLRLPSGAL
jgi:hypothetical protein